MSTSLGEVFVEIVGDADPLAADLSAALSDIGGTISDELSGAFDGVTDGLSDDFAEAGNEAGGALVDGVESEIGDLDIDTSGAFDGLTEDAQGAAEDVASAFDGVGEQIESSLSGAFDSITDSLGSVQGALGTAAGGAGLEGFARAQLPLTEQAQRLAAGLDLTEDRVRELALASSDVTRPLEQVLNTMEVGRQQGLKNEEQLMTFVAAWDTVGDATGLAADELAKLSPSLAAVGIEADSVEDAFAAFGYMTENTTMDVGEFLNIINRMGPELRDMNLDVDDTAAVLGAMQGELGLTGRVARQEFRKAVNEADGDMKVMLETLGLSEEQFADYRAEVGASGDIIARNAAIHGDSYTLIQRGQHVLEDLMFRFGGVADAASLVAAPIGALGPAMFGMNQASQLLSGGLAGRLVGGLKAAAGGFKTLSVAILTNPIFLIGAVLIGLGILIWKFRDEIIAGLTAAWDWIKDTAGALWEWLSDAFRAGVDAVVEFVSGLKDRIVEFFSSMVAFVMEYHPLAVAWRLAQEYVPRIIEAVTELVARVVEAVRGWVESVVGFVSDLWTRWVEIVHAIRDAVVGAVLGLVETVVSTVSGWVETIVELVTDLWQRWVDLVHTIRDAVIDAVVGLVSTVVSTVAGWVETIAGFVADLAARVIRGWQRIVEGVVSAVTQLVSRVVGAIRGWVTNLLGFVRNLRQNFVGTIRDLVTSAVRFFLDLPRRILAATSNFGRLLLDAGKALMRGLVDGIKNMAMAPVRAVREVGSNLVSGAKNLLRIGSPSRLFADEIGEPIMQGVAQGLRSSMADAIGEIERFANEASSTSVEVGATFREPSADMRSAEAPRSVRPSEVDPAGTGRAAASNRDGGTVVQNIYTVDPVKAATEAVRELRNLAYLSAPFQPPRDRGGSLG